MDPDHVDADRDASRVFFESYPLIFDGTRRTVPVAAWLYDMELIFHICHIEARLQVSLASRCFAIDARIWWVTLGERELPSRTWPHFRTVVMARYGPMIGEGAGDLLRDFEIYEDMHYTRYLSYVADWHVYPQETMAHYCRRFQESMLPYIPQYLQSPELQALVILRNGLPIQIRQYIPVPALDWSVGHMIETILAVEAMIYDMPAQDLAEDLQAPVEDAEMAEPVYEPGPVVPEDPIPPAPVPEVPHQEAEADMAAEDFDPDDLIIVPEDPPEEPPIIDISSDDEEDEELEPEIEHAGWLVEDEDFYDDPEEIPFADGEEESDSDASSVVTLEHID